MAIIASLRCTTLIGCALFVTGCAREPSEDDIRRATETMLMTLNANPFTQMIAGLSGTDGKVVEIHELHKLGCKQVSEVNGFRCDIELEVSTFGKRQRNRTSVRMVRGKDGWVAMQR